ncbi:MAG: hypothetical protein HZB13_05685 [Acidobacteria bacterium]|nr:hypothetical protein [Acidobacteriota bacterium]
MKCLWCVLTSLLVSVPVFAQQPSRPLLPQLKEYLQLTNGQIYAVAANNDDYNRKSAERQQRIRQVLAELTDETAKQDLDANALAARYLEIELICRDLKEAAQAVRKLNLSVLDEMQKSKLQALEEAMKLLPAFADAQSGNLSGNWMSPPAGFSNMSTASPVQLQFLGGMGPVMGCLGTGSLTVFAMQ